MGVVLREFEPMAEVVDGERSLGSSSCFPLLVGWMLDLNHMDVMYARVLQQEIGIYLRPRDRLQRMGLLS